MWRKVSRVIKETRNYSASEREGHVFSGKDEGGKKFLRQGRSLPARGYATTSAITNDAENYKRNERKGAHDGPSCAVSCDTIATKETEKRQRRTVIFLSLMPP